MENLSHSCRSNQASSTFSKKFHNNNGFAAKTVYDDVFGGPPKFGLPTFSPRVEDYREIFGNFNASRASSSSSSIPFLDLPLVDETETSFDFRSSNFDYSDIFGGFNSLDFSVSYEELFEQPKVEDDSSDEAWTPTESEYLSEESDPSASAAMNQFFSKGDSQQLFDEALQFNDSYHKTKQGNSEHLQNGMTHISHICSTSEITYVDDENSCLQKKEEKKTSLKVTDDINVYMDLNKEKMVGKHFRKTKSLPPKNSAALHSDGKTQSGYYYNAVHPIETFVTVTNISLRTCPSLEPPPSRPPPLFDLKKGGSARLASKHEASTNCALEGTQVDSSLPFFDVEVDACSSSAISAAAMKDAMDKAQPILTGAKELMERKKEVPLNSVNLGYKDGVKYINGKVGNMVDGSQVLLNEGVQEKCAMDDNEMIDFVNKQNEEPMETAELVIDAIEKENLLKAAIVLADKTHGKDSKESYITEGTGEWEKASEFYELRTDISGRAFEQVKNGKIFEKKSKVHHHGEEAKAAMEATVQIEENDKAVREAGEWEKNKRTLKAHIEDCEGNKIEDRLEEVKSTDSQEEHENVNKSDVTWDGNNYGEKLTEVDNWEEHEYLIRMHEEEVKNALMQRDNDPKQKQALNRFEDENKINDVRKSEDIEKRLGKTWKWEESEERLNKGFEKSEHEKRLQGTLDKEGNKISNEVPGWAENEKKEKLAHVRGGNVQKLRKSLEQEENEKKKEVLQNEEDEKRLKEAFEQKLNEKKLKEAVIKEDNEKKEMHAHVREDSEKRLKETCEGEKVEKRLQDAWGREKKEREFEDAQGRKGNEKKSREAYEREKIEKISKQSDKGEKTERRLKDRGDQIELKVLSNALEQTERDENESQKLTLNNSVLMEGGNLKASVETSKLEDYKNLRATQLPCRHEVNIGKLQTAQVASARDEDGKKRIETKDGRKQLGAVKMTKSLSNEGSEATEMAQVHLEHGESQIRMKDAGKSLTLNNKSLGSGQTQNSKETKASSVTRDSENLGKNVVHDWDGKGKNISRAQVFDDQNNKKSKPVSSHQVQEQVQIGRRVEAVPSSVTQGKGNTQKIALQVNIDQITSRKEKKETLTSEEKDREHVKREHELEKDRLRKMEEEMEREREREKDRMAVEIATCEARERSYVESRERAERTAVERENAEARQRALVEARERLEKACAEARQKSVAEKVLMEARLGVERASAGAREHAGEKQIAEKAPYDTRERVERYVADKHFASSRDDGTSWSSSSSELQSMGHSSGLRHPHTSSYAGVEGESAQRCRARLERLRRMAERVANALAEKNMRDLLAQREQAERTRVAETLDAEVKRWSNGKEGNLRALLSTLQYILGPGSGWQPIPLTDVITSVAAKKAYRKATLCVHPDKLQQRGASIQQKYICEKVFDLLKEAWNKFNSEEW